MSDLPLSFQPGTLRVFRGKILGKQACAARSIATKQLITKVVSDIYLCALNIVDQCKSELSWKVREDYAGDAEIYIILSDFARTDLRG